jgi:hypothetical protein
MKLRTTIGTIAGTGLGAMFRVIGFGAMAVLACAAISGLLGVHATGGIGFILTFSSRRASSGAPVSLPANERYSCDPDPDPDPDARRPTNPDAYAHPTPPRPPGSGHRRRRPAGLRTPRSSSSAGRRSCAGAGHRLPPKGHQKPLMPADRLHAADQAGWKSGR